MKRVQLSEAFSVVTNVVLLLLATTIALGPCHGSHVATAIVPRFQQ
jgi:hypothetical protein